MAEIGVSSISVGGGGPGLILARTGGIFFRRGKRKRKLGGEDTENDSVDIDLKSCHVTDISIERLTSWGPFLRTRGDGGPEGDWKLAGPFQNKESCSKRKTG